MHSSIQSRFAPILYVLIFFAGFLAAQVWFNQQAYLTNLPLLVTAISAVAFVWLIWAVVSARSKAKSKMLHREQLIQKESIHPVLHATLQRSDGQTDLLVLVVRNSGKGLAKNVRFEAEALPDHLPSKLIADAVMRLEMFSGGVDMLASGELYGGVFASMLALAAELPDQTFGGVLKLKAIYENAFGDQCTSESILDLSILNFNLSEIKSSGEQKPRKKLLY